MLKDIPFFGKDHEEAGKHSEEDWDITNYFNVSNANRDVILLRMLLVTLSRDEKV